MSDAAVRARWARRAPPSVEAWRWVLLRGWWCTSSELSTPVRLPLARPTDFPKDLSLRTVQLASGAIRRPSFGSCLSPTHPRFTSLTPAPDSLLSRRYVPSLRFKKVKSRFSYATTLSHIIFSLASLSNALD